MAKKTTAEKIAFYEAQIEKLKAEEAADAIRNNIDNGDKVTFNFGRGETRTALTGTVVGTKDDKNGRWIAILAGDGFDQQTYRVRVADITENHSRAKAAPVPPTNESSPSETPAPATVDPLDPLAQD